MDRADKDTRIALVVVDLDGGKSARTLLEKLDQAGGVRVELQEQAKAMTRLNLADIPRVLIIPENFSRDIAASDPTTLRLIVHPDADLEQTDAVRRVVEGVARDMSLEIQLIEALEQMREMQSGVRETADAFTTDRMQKQARSQFERAQTEPLVAVQQRVPQAEGTARRIARRQRFCRDRHDRPVRLPDGTKDGGIHL